MLPFQRRNYVRAWTLALLALAPSAAFCQSDLTDASLEDLLNLKVTSVEKKQQNLFRTAAAVYVLTREDIRRSGAMNIPDLLRNVPGVDVFQISADTWAISIRGFNQRYSNKVLVLIDGRTVYSPDFSGVFWDQQFIPVEDIDRIEVIRGPGGSVWGANAVNGVINIMTKPARATKGGTAALTGGINNTNSALLQYGGDAGAAGAYRVFGQYQKMDDLELMNGSEGHDGWSQVHGGFRSDWDLAARDSFTLQGDLFSVRESELLKQNWSGPSFTPPYVQPFAAAGGDLMARWNRTFAGGSQTSFQAYYDQYRRTEAGVPETLKTVDFDFQDHVASEGRHDLVWGLGYRSSASSLSPGYTISFQPPNLRRSLFSGFIQDEIRLSHSVLLTAGTKLEHNAITGFEYEPSVRLAWFPTDHQTAWAAASRAIREPANTDTAIAVDLETIPTSPYANTVLRLLGNRNVQEERLYDYELGYRNQFTSRLSLDAASFVSQYRGLETYEPQAAQILPGYPMTEILVPVLTNNKGRALTYGGEASLSFSVTPQWKLQAGYAFIHMTYGLDPSNPGTLTQTTPGASPKHTAQIHSQWNVSRRVTFDQTLYFDARVPANGVASHLRLDSRAAWRLNKSLEVSVVGQNLMRRRFLENGDAYQIVGTAVERSAYLKLSVSF
jgi:iron complex outermembrane receptor protein